MLVISKNTSFFFQTFILDFCCCLPPGIDGLVTDNSALPTWNLACCNTETQEVFDWMSRVWCFPETTWNPSKKPTWFHKERMGTPQKKHATFSGALSFSGKIGASFEGAENVFFFPNISHQPCMKHTCLEGFSEQTQVFWVEVVWHCDNSSKKKINIWYMNRKIYPYFDFIKKAAITNGKSPK